MTTFEAAVWVIGVVGLVRKARQELDGWSVVGFVFAMSGALAAAHFALTEVPTGTFFSLCAQAGKVGGVGIGLVLLTDRIASRLGRGMIRASIPAPAPAATAPSGPEPEMSVLHRTALVAVALLLACSGGCAGPRDLAAGTFGSTPSTASGAPPKPRS